MSTYEIDRRQFLKAAGVSAAALGISGLPAIAADKPKAAQTTIPRWRGFNLLDYFSPNPIRGSDRNRTTEDDLRWMSDWGYDFLPNDPARRGKMRDTWGIPFAVAVAPMCGGGNPELYTWLLSHTCGQSRPAPRTAPANGPRR